tara:strand:+ start:11658 stop:11774 length:117 start_codon:yes stop_codon:yes gene_type:complete
MEFAIALGPVFWGLVIWCAGMAMNGRNNYHEGETEKEK